ncbi:hypothetical protein ACFVZ3_06445 [Kitasatospora purpeofusca]|uniref:hypothetical protein n=1 Tax=Kitasatospora purpeofusca TaxID=67352 RepID=UPI00369CB8CB
MPNVATAEQKTAQRRMVGRVNAGGVLNRDGLAFWREADCGEFYPDADEVAQDLAVLQAPCEIVTAYRFPLANGYSKRPRKGYEVRIATKDLPSLEVWMPSLKDRPPMPEDAPGWAFMYFLPKPGRMEVCFHTRFAAAWPWWTEKQAGRMGLLCAECGYDLRKQDDETRLPYNVPTRPGGFRLVCGVCCDDGNDVIDRAERAASAAIVAAGAMASVPVPSAPSVPATFTAGGAS